METKGKDELAVLKAQAELMDKPLKELIIEETLDLPWYKRGKFEDTIKRSLDTQILRQIGVIDELGKEIKSLDAKLNDILVLLEKDKDDDQVNWDFVECQKAKNEAIDNQTKAAKVYKDLIEARSMFVKDKTENKKNILMFASGIAVTTIVVAAEKVAGIIVTGGGKGMIPRPRV